jgi:hypothetical protein
MTQEQYNKHEDEFLQFDRVENKTSHRADMHAFNLLDRLVPGNSSIIAGAEHEQIYLCVSPDALSEIATEEQIIELIRCGVFLSDMGTLSIFV